jgi:hypothetical protein
LCPAQSLNPVNSFPSPADKEWGNTSAAFPGELNRQFAPMVHSTRRLPSSCGPGKTGKQGLLALDREEIMNTIGRRCLGWAGLGLLAAGVTGCQTNVAGMTLPSGHYLQHPPQYFAPSPTFPLQRELAAMEAQEACVAGPAGQAPLPVPAPVAPPAPPQPAPLPAPVPAR